MGMREFEAFGVEHESRCGGGVSVESVSEDGVSQSELMGSVSSKLMGPAGDRPEPDPG